MFRFNEASKNQFSPTAKEVHGYNKALFYGFEELKKRSITNNLLIDIAGIITERDASFRDTHDKTLQNGAGAITYTPTQKLAEIEPHMKNLEQFINNPALSDFDLLVKIAIIHHQFESIRPFFDGSGPTGPVLNIFYLIQEGILDIPILYLSRYITQNKSDYYRLLQAVREKNSWEEWVIYMLNALESTAKQTISTIKQIKELMDVYKLTIRENTKIYSHELINNLFNHPCTKIDYLVKDMHVSRITATKYLNALFKLDLLEKQKIGTSN